MASAKSIGSNIDHCNSPAPAAAQVAGIGAPDGLAQSGYVTADWVKRRYSISNSTLYKWIAEKRFPAPVKIGPRAVRWDCASLGAFEAALMKDGR